MGITEADEYLAKTPEVERLMNGAPALADPTRLGLKKPDSEFRDVLKRIKSKHRGSNINTF